MTVLDEIQENLASRQEGAIEVTSLPKEYPAFTIRQGVEYGIAIPTNSDVPVAENFSSCSIHSRAINIEGRPERRYLVLTCTDETLRSQFASVCNEFADPGVNGKKRKRILENPFEWWKEWSELLGNIMADREPYSVIGEMMALDSLKREHKDVTWEAVHGGTHDIESPDASYEVKSTTRKYESTVKISSHNQLSDDGKKRLYLYFVRLEQSAHGYSIDDMEDRLVADGCDRSELERKLEHLGYEKGSIIRSEKYKCLETRKYTVDDSFPKITKDSFRNDKIPNNIVKIEYTVDLDGLNYTKW